jgi:hypothetical protein
MEVSWLAAWSAFTLAAFVRGAYPVEEFAAVFAAASALTSWSRRVGLSTIQLTALQVVGLGLFELHTFQSIGRAHGLAFCVWTAILWISGLLHARRAMDYATVCTRFDRGLAWLFSLMLFELLLRGQQGVALDPEATRAWLLPFVVSGVLAIVLTRNAARELRLQTALASAALLCVVGVVTVGLPDLRSPSVRTHGVSAVLDPLGSKAVEVFFWIGNIFEQSPGAAVSQREAMWSHPASRAGGSARKAMSWGSESSQLLPRRIQSWLRGDID